LEYVKCLQKGVSAPEFDSNDMLVIKAAETAAPADTTKK
jgi:hypothetical protein